MNKFVFSGILSLITLIFGCSGERNNDSDENHFLLSSIISKSPAAEVPEMDYEAYAHLKVPPLPPEKALEKFNLEEGFRIEVVAHEPMVVDPIAMDIDADGRLWVLDMPAYMPVHDQGVLETSAQERVPASRVVILEDSNSDGKMDLHRVFYEGLVLPRAIKVLTNGILVAEPPNVWFIQDTSGDGKGDKKESVYSSYGDHTDPNIHSFPGGLMWGMDNWLHSSNDNVKSIREVGGQWKALPFQRLGQWGMTQDNWGRLYSSNNARPLQTHLVPYGYNERHPDFDLDAGINLSIGGDTLWPAHPTGVNRGYRKGVLREDGTLIRATAASSTVIYRGDQFGREYAGNAFSPEPGANLIKRYIIEDNPDQVDAKARYAYEGREFLTSTDERFRPVNIYNAPDGALYVVDMYRGILEHASHLTDYLRDYAVEHDLHIPTGTFGRIYRIVREDREIDYNTPRFSQMQPEEWLKYLKHENGFLRDQAQQVIVQVSPPELIPDLEAFALDKELAAYIRLHAIWSLEGFDRSVYGLDRLTSIALQALEDAHPRVRAAAVRILEPAIAQDMGKVLEHLEKLSENETSAFVNLQLMASLGESQDNVALDIMAGILDEHVDSPYFREMALTGVYKREQQMAIILKEGFGWKAGSDDARGSLLTNLAEAGTRDDQTDLSHLTSAHTALYEKGRQGYKTCMACHGEEGEGLDGIGPPLAGSPWVQAEPNIPVRIVLQGFAGGSADRGENSIAGVMPGHSYMQDENIAAILTFIRQSWGNNAAPIEPEKVAQIRKETINRKETWSPESLQKSIK
jgi:mono/diheme cytochrome c family protein/glucose/arabinose dehydrogenase